MAPPCGTEAALLIGEKSDGPHVRLLFACWHGKVAHRDRDGRRGQALQPGCERRQLLRRPHLYLTHVRAHPGCGFPIPTAATLFQRIPGYDVVRSMTRQLAGQGQEMPRLALHLFRYRLIAIGVVVAFIRS